LERFRIAYAENDLVAGAIRRAPLGRLGVSATAVQRAPAMVELVKRERPQLCVLGCDPESRDVTRQLKALPFGIRPKVLTLIDSVDRELFQEVLQTNTDDWLFLPFTTRELTNALMSTLGRKQRIPLTRVLRVRVQRTKTHAWALNLDADGMLLAADEKLPLETTLPMTVELPRESVSVKGKVVRVEEVHGGVRYGVRFVGLKPEEQTKLATFDALSFSTWGDTSVIRVRYPITGELHLRALLPDLKSTVVFDLSAVTRINSMGISRWMEMIEAVQSRCPTILYSPCSWPFIHAASLMPSFLGNGRVLSTYLPYSCPVCLIDQEMLIDVEHEDQGDLKPRFCLNCTTKMTPEGEGLDLARVLQSPDGECDAPPKDEAPPQP
jgi:DNA-binding response OmpR family regulator